MRRKRVWYQGAIYHVMNRGQNHQDIFLEEEDYRFFLELLHRVKKKYPFELHAYCLMKNHYHLLIETKDDEIWYIMKMLGESYVRYFNRKYAKDGALFRGRYYSVLVKEDVYFLQVNRYITLNPWKAGLVKKPQYYRWSSYRTYLGMANDGVTQVEKTLAYFAGNKRKNYRRFIEHMPYDVCMEM